MRTHLPSARPAPLLAAILAAVLSTLAPARPGGAAPPAPGLPDVLPAAPTTGAGFPEVESFDRVIQQLMARWGMPGGAVAVVKDGRLVLARGYGWADVAARQPVEPQARFRLASLSKSLTAAAVLRLVEMGRLRLEDRAFRLLDNLRPAAGARVDRRIDEITVLDLLRHAGGWDRDRSFDPMFRAREIAAAMGVGSPPGPDVIVRYMMGQPLQFAPGTRYSYSNFGYCVLGRVIERVSGEPYEAFVQREILRPAGITCMRLGRTLPAEQAPDKVRYYGHPGLDLAPSVFGTGRLGQRRVPWPYGGWSIEAMDAHGGWIASAPDLARFIAALEGRADLRGLRPILTPGSVRQMVARPPAPLWAGSDVWYGMGWMVRPMGGDANWWHLGSLDGTSTLMVRAANGLSWVALFNSRPKDSDSFGGELDRAMWRAVGSVRQWPDRDLFAIQRTCPSS